MKKNNVFSFMLLITLTLSATAFGKGIPQIVNYQGYLAGSDGNSINGQLRMEFSIYATKEEEIALWSEGHDAVIISDGYFTVLLGSITPISQSVFSEGTRYLGIKIGTDEELKPRQQITSVAYAFSASNADSLGGLSTESFVRKEEANVVSTGMIQDNALTADKIQPVIISSLDGVANDGGNVDLVAGSNITITPDDEANAITISATPGGGGGDITAVTAGDGLGGGATSGDAVLNVNIGPGLQIVSDAVQIDETILNALYVNESQSNSISVGMITPNLISSLDGVSNDGGNVDLVAGSNITITPDDGANKITISASGGSGGDITAVNAGDGLIGGGVSGDVTLNINPGSGLIADADKLSLDQTLIDSWYVNEGQSNSVTSGMITPNVVSSLDGVSNDGGNIDLIAGSNVIITPDDGANTITISATGSGGGDITSVTAGTGLNGGGTSGDVTLDVEVPLQLSSSTSQVIKGTHTGSGNYGYLGGNNGVYGNSSTGIAIYGYTSSGIGVSGYSNSGTAITGATTSGIAGSFTGNVSISGHLYKSSGSFRIDHPLDPANKYLQHSFVESPDMMNVYNGNVVLDAKGEAVVELPAWFEALNRDFRYQLTCIGGFAPVYIAEKIERNQFKIAGGSFGLEVSWQVTGIRQDAWAEAHRIEIEVDKKNEESGKYLHPKELGVSEALGVNYEELKRLQSE